MSRVICRFIQHGQTQLWTVKGAFLSFHHLCQLLTCWHLGAYIHKWTMSSLVQAMAWHLSGAKPLPEPMMTYYQSDLYKQTSIWFWSKCNHFHWRKKFKNAFCKLSAILSRPKCPNLPLDQKVLVRFTSTKHWLRSTPPVWLYLEYWIHHNIPWL